MVDVNRLHFAELCVERHLDLSARIDYRFANTTKFYSVTVIFISLLHQYAAPPFDKPF